MVHSEMPARASQYTGCAPPTDMVIEQDGEQQSTVRIRVLLADDHALLRAGTRRILEDEADLWVVAEAGDGYEAVTMAATTHPDVIVLDISMPNMNGITAYTELRRVAPHARVLILTAHERAAYVKAFHRLGAPGYLLKSAPASELVAAIRQVHAGEYVYCSGVSGQLGRTENIAVTPTARELEVVRKLAAGLTNREISETLHLSENTIEFHVRNAYRKLGATSRTDAVRNAQRLQWLDTSDPLC